MENQELLNLNLVCNLNVKSTKDLLALKHRKVIPKPLLLHIGNMYFGKRVEPNQ